VQRGHVVVLMLGTRIVLAPFEGLMAPKRRPGYA